MRWEEELLCQYTGPPDTFDSTFLNIEDDCLNLTDYGIQARYPFNLELNENDAQQAIKYAERVQAFLLEKVSLS